jgi:hypothetical protein
MPDPAKPQPAAIELCQHLRSKEMFYAEDSVHALLHSGSGVYWCIHTQNCLGPDGQVAEPRACQPGRGCYKPL